MKTRELINLLASDGVAERLRPVHAVLLAAAGSLVASALMFVLLLDPRPDIRTAAASAPFLLKLFLVAILAFTALGILFRLARPEGVVGPWSFGLLGSAVLLAAAVAVELLTLPPSIWIMRLMGVEPLACLASVLALSVLPLLVFLVLFRQCAPGDPPLVGAVSGLAAASISIMVYLAHCPNDSPLFVVVWYMAALLIVVLAGFQLGKRVLRW